MDLYKDLEAIEKYLCPPYISKHEVVAIAAAILHIGGQEENRLQEEAIKEAESGATSNN